MTTDDIYAAAPWLTEDDRELVEAVIDLLALIKRYKKVIEQTGEIVTATVTVADGEHEIQVESPLVSAKDESNSACSS